MVLLDQTRLPGERGRALLPHRRGPGRRDPGARVRGAPALGVAGSDGHRAGGRDGARAPGRDAPVPGRAGGAPDGRPRPTAVNLGWGVQQALAELDRDVRSPPRRRAAGSRRRARRIHDEEVAALPRDGRARRGALRRRLARAHPLQHRRARHGGLRHGARRHAVAPREPGEPRRSGWTRPGRSCRARGSPPGSCERPASPSRW